MYSHKIKVSDVTGREIRIAVAASSGRGQKKKLEVVIKGQCLSYCVTNNGEEIKHTPQVQEAVRIYNEAPIRE